MENNFGNPTDFDRWEDESDGWGVRNPLRSKISGDIIPDGSSVLDIGAGSMVGSHANDSLFWIFTQMTGMDVKTGFRIHTVGTVVIGFASALVIWGISLFLI